MFKRIILLLLGLLILWQLIIWLFHLPVYFVPSVCNVGLEFIHEPGLLWAQTWPTLLEALVGLIMALISGVVLAVLMSLSQPVKFWLLPLMVVSQAIPTFAFAPIIVIWLGYGVLSKIAVTAFVLFFVIASALFDGLERTPRVWLDMAAIEQASRWRTLSLIRFPAALPSLGSGLKMAAAWAPMAAVIGEWVGASRGLGFLMLNANARVDTPLTFAALVVLIFMSMILYGLISILVQRYWWWSI